MAFDDARSAEIRRARPIPELTDPKVMRAIAHPVRLNLLDVLAIHQPLTATEAAELVGESPTNTAFHLRTLAKYGFIEEAGDAPGRRRPWRLREVGYTLDVDTEDTEAATAGRALVDLEWRRWFERANAARVNRSSLPEEERKLVRWSQSLMFVTPEEAEQLRADLREVLLRYLDRIAEPQLRPEGSIPFEVLLYSYPLSAANVET